MTPHSEKKVLLSNGLRLFIEHGGTFHYEPALVDDRMVWYLYGDHPDGYRQQVYVAQSGTPKVFKSANAIVIFHRLHFPDATEVTIPVL